MGVRGSKKQKYLGTPGIPFDRHSGQRSKLQACNQGALSGTHPNLGHEIQRPTKRIHHKYKKDNEPCRSGNHVYPSWSYAEGGREARSLCGEHGYALRIKNLNCRTSQGVSTTFVTSVNVKYHWQRLRPGLLVWKFDTKYRLITWLRSSSCHSRYTDCGDET